MVSEPLREIWLRDLSEGQLAGYQQNQGKSNHCGEFAAAAALGVLFERIIPGHEMVKIADRGWLFKRLRFWPGGPTSPAQQTRLIREYARMQHLKLDVSARRSTSHHLRGWLAKPDAACLVTIAWDNRWLPGITKGFDELYPVQKSRSFWSGHTMLLAAFQPPRATSGLSFARWGFVNSWADPTSSSSIFWMEDHEFRRCWEYPLFPIGSRNVVVVRKHT